jgi:DNA-binding NarL/FixJ family response regulator
LDLSLPDSFGLDTLIKVYKIASDTPIIVTSGSDNEATRLSALEQGAQDYLSKDNLTGETLVRSIQHAIQRKQAKLGDRQ